MKRIRRLLLSGAAFLWAGPALAQAQFPTPGGNINVPGAVIMCPNTAGTCVPCGSPSATALPVIDITRPLRATTAVSVGTNFNTVNTVSTATATPQAGQYVYVTAMFMGACEDATGGAVSNVNWTTTNLEGATFPFSMASAASTCSQLPGLLSFPVPLKSAAPGTAVTLVSPTAATHTGYASEIFWYSSP